MPTAGETLSGNFNYYNTKPTFGQRRLGKATNPSLSRGTSSVMNFRPIGTAEERWIGSYAEVIRQERAAEAAAMMQRPPELAADVIRKVHLRLDTHQDMVFEFENGERRFALVVVLQDRTKLGWKECQALGDCMQVAARGTPVDNDVFGACCEQLKQKFGSVRGPTVEHNRLVCLVKPGPGAIRTEPPETLSHVEVSFDAIGDFRVQAHTVHKRLYDVTLCLPVKMTQCFSIVDCEAFISVLRMLEVGDPVDSVTFVSYLAILRSNYNFIRYSRTGNHFTTSLLASNVENKAPIEAILVQAYQAKLAQQAAADTSSTSTSTRNGLPHCPYPKISYTHALQESGQAQVYAGVMDGTKVAVKVFKGEADEASETYRQELRMLLKKPDHKNVIEVLEFFENPAPALVTRLVEGEGDLMAYMKKYGSFKEEQGRQMATGIADAICHLHKHGIIHRDLKTPNILVQRVSEERLRPIVIDLGLGSTLSKKKASTTMTMETLVASMAQTGISAQTDGTKGTILWMAPEMARDQEWSEKTDVFAFGIMLWELFSGDLPYNHVDGIQTGLDLLVKVCNEDTRPEMSKVSHVSSVLTNLMKQCWEADPKNRPSMQHVLDILRGNDPVAIFRSIDTDGSNSLNYAEFVQFLTQYAPKIKPAEMHSIFEAIDENDDGDIGWDEFERFYDIVQKSGLESALTLYQQMRARQAPCPLISHDFGAKITR